MKVLQINSFFSVGGPPRIMNGIYDTLKENGHDCKIASAREEILYSKDSIRIGTSRGVYINAFEARILDNDGFAAKKATRELIKKIENYNPDIIQLHNLHGYYINIEILFEYLKHSGKPVAWTMHDCWSVTGHCSHFTTIKCERYKQGCFQCPLKKAYPSSYVLDQSKKNWERKKKAFGSLKHLIIITPSQWLADIIKGSYLQEKQIKVIHNGIDLNTFSHRSSNLVEKYGINKKKIILGVAQNWAENKGFEDFVKLSELLGNEYQVVIIGLTEKQIKGIPSRVLGLKRTNSVDELAQWYSEAQVFVNMTYQDNFPTVNIEALACGTPVITYQTGGSPEAVDESCGWVVMQGDLNQVATVIKGMGDKEDYRKAANKRSELFDRKRKYREYITLYQDLINEAGR